jgi:hypothetical protein
MNLKFINHTCYFTGYCIDIQGSFFQEYKKSPDMTGLWVSLKLQNERVFLSFA